jgi:hypothetical protein
MEVTLSPPPLSSGTLNWVHQKNSKPRTWVLRSGGANLASLTWEKVLGNTATARTADHSWRFERQGLFRRRILLHDDHHTLIGELIPNWLGRGELALDGRRFKWRNANFWGSRWEMLGDNTRLLEFRMKRWSYNPSAQVTVTHAALKYQELPLLLAFGWYLCVLNWKDRAHS